jgi:hypothetical protein
LHQKRRSHSNQRQKSGYEACEALKSPRKSSFIDSFRFQAPQTIEIGIISLELTPNSSFLAEDNNKLLYVEYQFLGYLGHMLETQSLQKPKKANEPIFYRYSQKFEVKPDSDKKKMKLLKSMVEKNSSNPLKFIIVSEPSDIDDINNDEQCEEMG